MEPEIVEAYILVHLGRKRGKEGRKEYPVDKSVGGINAAPTNKGRGQVP